MASMFKTGFASELWSQTWSGQYHLAVAGGCAAL